MWIVVVVVVVVVGVAVVVVVDGEEEMILPRLSECGNLIGVGNKNFVVDGQWRVRIGGRCCLRRDLLRHDKIVDEVVVCECDCLVYYRTWRNIDLMLVRRTDYVDLESVRRKI